MESIHFDPFTLTPFAGECFRFGATARLGCDSQRIRLINIDKYPDLDVDFWIQRKSNRQRFS